MRYTNQESSKHLTYIALCSLTCFVFIIIRLFFFQIYQYQRFNWLGERNFTRIKKIEPLRGNILDCHGNLLATNKSIINIDWNGSGLTTLSQTQLAAIYKVEAILQKYNHPCCIQFPKIRRAEKFGTNTRLASDINMQALSEISEQCADCTNITVSKKFQRYYPHKDLACHILGYLGDINQASQSIGKMGLELVFQESLQGKHGSVGHIINSFGKNLQNNLISHCQSGQNLVTTIDLRLQEIAESIMPNDHAGVFILLNPKTGALRSLVSKPGFDPSIFLKPISNQDWQNLQIDRPFINRAFNAAYPPASIFKLVTISAALEQKIIVPESTFYCHGHIKFKGRKYFCNKKWGHGLLDIKSTLAHSCNIACYEIAQKISIDTLADYAFRFGLGQKTNNVFPEMTGIIPSQEWKKIFKGESWWTGETLSAAIGQSFLLVTPIQIACMIGSIFNGFLVQPRILETSEVQTTPLDIKPSTLTFLQESMKQAIDIGSGRNMNKLKNISIYAKTGTAQTKSRSTENKEMQNDCHAWCAVYFTYQDHDPLVIVILIEHAGGSVVATNVAKKFLSAYMKQ